MQPTPSRPISLRSILILSYHLRLLRTLREEADFGRLKTKCRREQCISERQYDGKWSFILCTVFGQLTIQRDDQSENISVSVGRKL